MRANRVPRHIAGFIVIVAFVVETTAQGNGPNSTQRVVDDVLSQVQSYKMTWVEAERRLDEFSDDAVISAIVTALNREVPLSEGAHNFAYSILQHKGAARTEAGFRQLIAGLENSEVTSTCVEALLDAPEHKQGEVLEHIRRYLKETKTPITSERSKEGHPTPPAKNEIYVGRVLNAIGRKREDAIPYIDTLDSMLRDPERSLHVRTAAAVAITKIKPLPEAVEHFDDLDAAGLEASLKAWARPVAELISEYRKAKKSLRDENPLFFQKLRQLTLNGLNSSRPETQEAALEPMACVFSDDLIVIRSREDYEFNPELLPILKRISESHPDTGVRQSVQQLLDPQSIERRVVNILHERQSHNSE